MSVCVQMILCGSEYMWISALCVSVFYGHVTSMFMNVCFYVHVLIHIYIGAMCVMSCVFVFMCLTVGTCGGVFVRVFYLSVCRRESSDLCSEPSIYMYTVPSSGHEKKASKTKQKKKEGWRRAGSKSPPIPDWSMATHRAKFPGWTLRGQEKASHPLHRGLCAGSLPQCAGPASQCGGERAHSLAWRQNH